MRWCLGTRGVEAVKIMNDDAQSTAQSTSLLSMPSRCTQVCFTPPLTIRVCLFPMRFTMFHGVFVYCRYSSRSPRPVRPRLEIWVSDGSSFD